MFPGGHACKPPSRHDQFVTYFALRQFFHIIMFLTDYTDFASLMRKLKTSHVMTGLKLIMGYESSRHALSYIHNDHLPHNDTLLFPFPTCTTTTTQCRGFRCARATPSVALTLQVAVTFTDVSKGPLQLLKSTSSISGKLPQDFLYPFFVSGTNGLISSNQQTLLLMIELVAIFILSSL